MDVKLFSAAARGAGSRRAKRPSAAEMPHSFTLERLLAIFESVQQAEEEAEGGVVSDLESG